MKKPTKRVLLDSAFSLEDIYGKGTPRYKKEKAKEAAALKPLRKFCNPDKKTK